MLSDIWTQCAGPSEIRPLLCSPWRVVESQHQVATRKLVDSIEEQELLEALIDRGKPPAVAGSHLHYLLTTPFRYPPLRHGSRFGDRNMRGIWYGAETVATALAEVAYYRLLFLEGTSGDLGRLAVELSAFRVHARSLRGVDLVAPPFAFFRDVIASPSQYAAAQALGAAMRAGGVELCRYPSARDPGHGVSIAVFAAEVFGRRTPQKFQRWDCSASRERVEMARRDFTSRESVVFDRRLFLVNGELPAPAVD